jgi:hypothetical protein
MVKVAMESGLSIIGIVARNQYLRFKMTKIKLAVEQVINSQEFDTTELAMSFIDSQPKHIRETMRIRVIKKYDE